MNKVIRFARKYKVLLQTEWAITLAYRTETFIWMIGSFVQPLVSLMVWLSISEDGAIGNYGASEFILYFVGVMFVGRMTGSWDVWSLDDQIRQGTFSHHLIRPFHPIHRFFAGNLAGKLFWAALLIPVWIVLAAIFPAIRPPLDPWLLLSALLSIVLALSIRFLLGFQIGILAFWTNRAISIYLLYDIVHLFMSGRIAPLSIFPKWVITISEWLPFYITVGFPAELLTGQMTDGGLIMKYFSLQCFWLAALFGLFYWQWKRGLKKYAAVGG